MFVAKEFYITVGYGIDEHEIASFDKALVTSGLGDYNLVRVSSIIPPNAKQTTCVNYKKGSVLFTAYSRNSTNKNELIASAIVAAIPKESNKIGVIMEYSCKNNKQIAVNTAKQLAEDAMSRRGIDKYNIIAKGIDAQGKDGIITTTFAAIALL